ncbi:uncharacterized protein FPRO_14799 [Fusarium proliferatum ET1]|nr:uncharacterized protein FPRO_15792 [Fusarium proliferatum ET1]XP_031090222.1 uncharacterized protein FPRO_14799 [Fusarium proliferatum ET1]CZR45033.1 uncharacterized protein FPRO_15792 [Fusarium proliferatum ET1]CZR49724.1 uncharacterized protein FPRO_14799 [Fusarium proliferatum ET1]
MASSPTIPPVAPDPFDLGVHTPANLNRRARAALLQNSPAVVNSPIGVSPRPGRTAQTPSSPLNAATTAAATEGAERANPASTPEQQPISIIESANDLARKHAEEYDAKLMVFQAFCAKLEEANKQFTSGPQRRFAQKFVDSVLDAWKRELSSDVPASKPTYSSVAAASLPADRARTAHQHHHHQQQQQHRQSGPPHRQEQQATIAAPPRQDLRVFVRLEAGAPARDHSGYAIRTLIREKLGTVSDKVRQVFQVRSGWAVLTADHETRDFLVEKQAEWAAELGATAVETNKEWHTYVVSDFPRRLTDFRGNEVDSDSVVSDEIEIQTGLKPVDIRPGRQFSDNPLTKTLLVSFLKPTKKRFWSLFGSRAARLVDKSDVPKQCETCWGYHFTRKCHRQPVCQRCGKTGHSGDDCAAWEQCVNCLGPHDASLRAVDSPYENALLDRPTTPHPVESWDSNDTRPRVMTYVRRDPRLLADQIRPFQTRDILWITINGVTVVNFYRQNDERDALDTLLRWPPGSCLVAGDFTEQRRRADYGPRPRDCRYPTKPRTQSLLPTSHLLKATVEDHSRRHFTLSLTLPNIKPAPLQPGKIRVTTEDELKRSVETVELEPQRPPQRFNARGAGQLFTSKAVGRPSRKGGCPAPWWTEECACAAAAFGLKRPPSFNQDVKIAKRDFHRVVRRAKRKYWRELIDSFSSAVLS